MSSLSNISNTTWQKQSTFSCALSHPAVAHSEICIKLFTDVVNFTKTFLERWCFNLILVMNLFGNPIKGHGSMRLSWEWASQNCSCRECHWPSALPAVLRNRAAAFAPQLHFWQAVPRHLLNIAGIQRHSHLKETRDSSDEQSGWQSPLWVVLKLPYMAAWYSKRILPELTSFFPSRKALSAPSLFSSMGIFSKKVLKCLIWSWHLLVGGLQTNRILSPH